MIRVNLLSQFKIVNILFILSTLVFVMFPTLDIHISNYFFVDGKFISEKYAFIKILRNNLKTLMIVIPILSLILLLVFIFMTIEQQSLQSNSSRHIEMNWKLLI